ncbi:Succinate dehydrogenase subunit C [Planctomycetales bacterium 10988]|nr:Succinate dehydrogenase subunit C [Planctomycetales bacterium 10988]
MEKNASLMSFYYRHEFLIRRLHSLLGLIPIGAYMMVHLTTNASILAGSEIFQKNVDTIHSLGPALPLVEWAFIFTPILFHGIIGVLICFGGKSNLSSYHYVNNYRYTAQRVTGIIAFLFLFYHIMHQHHYGEWLGPYFGMFDPHHATSSVGESFAFWWVKVIYLIGITASIYHLANGIWTAGITWGLWVTPKAQQRADLICFGLGIIFLGIGLAAFYAASTVDIQQVRAEEDAGHDAEVLLKEGEDERLDPTEVPAEEDSSSAEAEEASTEEPTSEAS